MIDHMSKSKKAKVDENSPYDFEDLEEEQVPFNTYKSGSSKYFLPSTYRRKPRLPVISSAPSSKRQVLQSNRGKSGDENQQVNTSGYNSKPGMSRNKDIMSCPNQVVVTASRARLNQHYGRFLTVIFSAKHIEVKQAKEILSRKWQREDLCVFKSFYKFFSENADEKALVVLQLHQRRVFGNCSGCECTNPSDLTETLVMEIKNDVWMKQQREIFEFCKDYRSVWRRIEGGEEMLKYKERLSRYPLEDLSINGNFTRKTEVERIPELLSPPARLSEEVRNFETLVYPLGDPDAVTITTKDVDILRPMGFLNDTIIDFYIKYLQNQLSAKDKTRFYFFNSFFFRKLVDSSNKYTGPDRGKVIYDRVRKWTRKVSLFEKDYIFIPVNQCLHWSLIIVCHLSLLGCSTDKRRGTPCILHLDSMEGSHGDIEEHIRNYILQAWNEEHQSSANDSSEAALSQMKYIEAMVPQQINHCDCGTYLLHYVELFLKEAPQNFSLASFEGFPYFLTRDWFKSSEASAKRSAIRNLLIKLHRGSHSGATDRQAKPLQEQATSTSLEGPEELLVIDEDDVCISSGSKVIHSMICEELEGAGKQATSPEAGAHVVEIPLIVDLQSDDEANEASPSEDDWRMLDGMDGKLRLSSTSAHAHHSSNPFSSAEAPRDIPAVFHSSEWDSNDDSARFSSSADLSMGLDKHGLPSPSLFDINDDNLSNQLSS